MFRSLVYKVCEPELVLLDGPGPDLAGGCMAWAKATRFVGLIGLKASTGCIVSKIVAQKRQVQVTSLG